MFDQDLSVPVIAIDGASSVGKGTARISLAAHLGFNSLDSGVLYRALAFVCNKRHLTDPEEIAVAARTLDVRFDGERILLEGRDQTTVLRSEECGILASQYSKIPEVRTALLRQQLRYRRAPGLVADGRDMGCIFNTPYRYFLTASAEVQARRCVGRRGRAGETASYEETLLKIQQRDATDRTRQVSPLEPHPDAVVIDTSDKSPQEVFAIILEDFLERVAA